MAQELPEYKRSVGIETGAGVENFGAAARDYGAASNWMSSVGSQVTQSASQAMATQMGYEKGKNPDGDLLPPITDFDKHYANAYITQSSATLNLQAEKLLSESQLEMAKATKLTPQLIANNQSQLAKGLKNISDLAPTAIKGDMEGKFGSVMLNNTTNLTNKMITQQKQETRNTYLLSSQKTQQTIYELSHGGHFKEADAALQGLKRDITVAKDQGYVSLIEADTAIKSGDKINKVGQYTNQYMRAEDAGVGPDFLKQFALKKPENLTYQEWPTVTQGLAQFVSQRQSLRSQDEALRMTKFNESLVVDPTNISGEQWADLQANLSPNNFEKMRLSAITAIQKANKTNAAVINLANNFTDSEVFSGATPKERTGAFNRLVEQGYKDAQDKGSAASRDDIKRNVAAQAPGPIKSYMDELKTKINGRNGDEIEAAGTAVDFIAHSGNGQNVDLDKATIAKLGVYRVMRSQYPTTQEAADAAQNAVYNKSVEQREANEANLSSLKKELTSGGKKTSYFIGMANIPSGATVRNTPELALHAEEAFDAYYRLTNGDVGVATKMVQDDFARNYGVSDVNKNNEYTYMPIEKTLNLPANSIGVIQSDIASQANMFLSDSKTQYDNNQREDYWEIVPGMSTKEAQQKQARIEEIKKIQDKSPISEKMFDVSNNRQELIKLEQEMEDFNKGKGIKAIRNWRNKKPQVFELGIQANPWSKKTNNPSVPIVGGWDIVVKTEKGYTPIPMLDPHFQFPSFIPNKTSIEKEWMSINSTRAEGYIEEGMKPADLLSKYYK